MKKTLSVSTLVSLLISLGVFVPAAQAATVNATAVESFSQGLRKNGSAVDVGRSDPTKALGAADGDFVSLGYGGELDLQLPVMVGTSLTITVTEVTGGTYPLESADVYVSDDASSWTLIGTATNSAGEGPSTVLPLREGTCIQYVRLLETTDSSIHNSTSDGFDVDAISADFEEECQPEEPQEPRKAGPVRVINGNESVVLVGVGTAANSGGNTADGGDGGDSGKGGSVVLSDDDNTGGNSGRGGDGGNGGSVRSGSAIATSQVGVTTNSNVTRVSTDCGCYTSVGKTVVVNRNSSFTGVGALTGANSGRNASDGGSGGNTGNAGSVILSDDGNTGGNGGRGGRGGDAGSVTTGDAVSYTGVSVLANRNNTRR